MASSRVSGSGLPSEVYNIASSHSESLKYGELQVLQMSSHLTLRLGASSVDFQLPQLTAAAEVRQVLRSLLFSMAGSLESTASLLAGGHCRQSEPIYCVM